MSRWFRFLCLYCAFSVYPSFAKESQYCLDAVCIGDDIEALELDWQTIKLDYNTNRSINTQLENSSIEDLYASYNEILIADKAVLSDLAPYVIVLQKFDKGVLEKLKSVSAICTPLSLTGELKGNQPGEKLIVTFRAIADDGKRGKLRVIQLEREYKIFPPHLRPSDKNKYAQTLKSLSQHYGKVVEVRDIDARAETDEVAYANVLLGFRFFSDSYNPLILRIRDGEDIESIEFDSQRHPSCKSDSR